MSVRTARYGKLIRGWDWRTSHERLTKAEARAKSLGLTRTQYLEYCIDKESGMDNPTFEIKTIDGHNVATVTYSDGTTFTTDDWQGQQPKDGSEVEQYDWQRVDASDPANTALWQPAFLLMGWPRVMV